MKSLKIVTLAICFFAAGSFSARATSTLPSTFEVKPPTNSPKPVRTRVFTPTRTPTRVVTPTLPATLTKTQPVTSTTTFTASFTPTFTATPVVSATPPGNTFTFASMGDAQNLVTNFLGTTNQIASLNPAFVLFNGDLESNGVAATEINQMVGVLKNSGIFNETFLVRGNHDNYVAGSSTNWESFFETAPNIRTFPSGVSDYVSLNSSSDTLTYSFNFGNSIFIGLDVPGDVGLLTTAELTFLDSRLTFAESKGLVHAFIFFHGPMYCVESLHCGCTTKTDASCTPSNLISVINKHPIVSAFLHGHEHILGWTHMDNSRIASLTINFEEFLTSPSGGSTYNANLFPARVDYFYPTMGTGDKGFATILVNGKSFTYSIYKVGTTTPVWSKTFTK